MTDTEPGKLSVDLVLGLVDQLSADDQLALRRQLNSRSWSKRFNSIADRIESHRLAFGLPRMGHNELVLEIRAIRARKEQNDDKSRR